MNKIYVILILFLIKLIINKENKNKQNESNIINWGKKNNLEISSLIGIQKVNGTDKFIALNDIESKTEILKIPYQIIFNISKILELINSDELKEQYKLFEKLDIPTYQPHHIDLQKEEIFLSYIFYLIQHEPQLYNKTKFYERYKLYISSFKNYIPKSPLFYTQEQIESLSETYLGKFHNKIKKLFEEEIKILKSKSYYNKEIIYKDYVYNRLFVQNKGLEVFGNISMIPFLNFFDRDYMKYNARFIIIRGFGDIKIITKNKIKKGESIIVLSPKWTNVERMIFEGELNNYSVNYKEIYIIPAFGPGLYYKYNIDDKSLVNAYNINLAEENYESKAINLYKNFNKLFNGDGGDIWAYGILLENINYYKEYIKNFIKDKIDNIFKDDYDRIHIEREMKAELKVLGKSSEFIQNKLAQLKSKEKEDNNNSEL